MSLIFVVDVRRSAQGIGDQLPVVDWAFMHIHGADATVFIGGVVVDAPLRITAGRILRDLVLPIPDQDTASRHCHRG